MFRMIDGAEFLAANEADLVRQIHASSRSPSPSDAAFMAELASRAKTYSGATVRHDTPEHLVEDLIAAGLMTELSIH